MSHNSAATCDNESNPRGAGHTTEGSNPEIAYTIGGLRVSVPNQYTSTIARGAASEMIASAYLMARGFHVFRAVAASCPVDLIAWKDDEILRVEVKSLTTSNAVSFSFPVNDAWDLLLIVSEAGLVHEFTYPATYEAVRDQLRDRYGFGPAPVRAPRSSKGPVRSPSRPYTPRPVVHGTWGGYCNHKRKGTPVCTPCERACQQFIEENRSRRLATQRQGISTWTRSGQSHSKSTSTARATAPVSSAGSLTPTAASASAPNSSTTSATTGSTSATGSTSTATSSPSATTTASGTSTESAGTTTPTADTSPSGSDVLPTLPVTTTEVLLP